MSDAEQDYERLKARWQEAHRSPHAAHSVVLPPDTDTKVTRRWLTQHVATPRWRYLTYAAVFWLSMLPMLLGWAHDLLAYVTR
ncbi:hypothetical protein [Streptomyces sp. bgisy154]|uniref:hypothetical protein n=1 Tax=Streptomyces sp. bgisy154 TaxID=3413794 RepID=UPI003D736A79